MCSYRFGVLVGVSGLSAIVHPVALPGNGRIRPGYKEHPNAVAGVSLLSRLTQLRSWAAAISARADWRAPPGDRWPISGSKPPAPATKTPTSLRITTDEPPPF
jgi:hypothetical protein